MAEETKKTRKKSSRSKSSSRRGGKSSRRRQSRGFPRWLKAVLLLAAVAALAVLLYVGYCFATLPDIEKAVSRTRQPSTTVIAENGILTDDLGADYSLTLYTTAKPCGQVICNEDIIELAPGEKHKIEYSLLDTADGDVTLEIADGNDIVTLENGFVTVNENALKGDMAAVKIALRGNENIYDVVLVKVI